MSIISTFTPALTDIETWASLYAEKLAAVNNAKWATGLFLVDAITQFYPDYFTTTEHSQEVKEFTESISELAGVSASTTQRWRWATWLFYHDHDSKTSFNAHLICSYTEKRGHPETEGYAAEWMRLYRERWADNTGLLKAQIAATGGNPFLVGDDDAPAEKGHTETLMRTKRAWITMQAGRRLELEFDDELEPLPLGHEVVVSIVSRKAFDGSEA